MRRENLNDYLAFIAVAREKSFTKAASRSVAAAQPVLGSAVGKLDALARTLANQ